MKKGKMLVSVGAVMIIWVSIMFLTPPLKGEAQVKPFEGVNFEVSHTMKDNLKMFIGKNIYITLRSGKTYQGSLKSVGDHFIHLEKIAGKDFFDALIRMEDISVFEVQFRGYKQ